MIKKNEEIPKEHKAYDKEITTQKTHNKPFEVILNC